MGEGAYCFLLSFALGLRLLYPHLRHLVAFFGLVAEQFMQTVLSRSLLSASLKRAMVFTSWKHPILMPYLNHATSPQSSYGLFQIPPCRLHDMDRAEISALFDRGFDCTQCVVSAFREELGDDFEAVMHTASCMGMGLFRGTVCGAILGGLIVIGWRYGSTEPDASSKGLALIKREQFLDEFQKRNGRLTCPDLMGVDVRTNEGNTKAYADGLFDTLCTKLCLDAIDIAKGLI